MEICEHLKPILEHEELVGNSVKEVSEGWSKANFVVDMQKEIDADFEINNIKLEKFVRLWEYNGSPHNTPSKGFFCDKCKHSISGPK